MRAGATRVVPPPRRDQVLVPAAPIVLAFVEVSLAVSGTATTSRPENPKPSIAFAVSARPTA